MRRVSRTLIAVLVMGVTACVQPPERTPSRYVVFADASTSPGDQTALWMGAAEQRICRPLGAGDVVEVFSIGSRTADRAPVYEGRVRSARAGIDGDLGVRGDVKRVCASALDAVRSIVERRSERSTHILDSIERVKAQAGYGLHILYLSDGLEASPSVNLERVRLDNESSRSLARTIVGARGWPSQRLAGAVVDFVLDSQAGGAPVRRNRRADLEVFWSEIFAALGASLRSFDARITLASMGDR